METERLCLRPWRESDAEVLYRLASDPEVGPRAGWPPHQSVEESREIILTVFNNDTTWAIVRKRLMRWLVPSGMAPPAIATCLLGRRSLPWVIG